MRIQIGIADAVEGYLHLVPGRDVRRCQRAADVDIMIISDVTELKRT